MSKNLITIAECEQIVNKLPDNENRVMKVIDYDVENYSNGYPGFLGDYFSLTIKFKEVREKNLKEKRRV